VLRMGGAVIVMEIAALAVAYGAFGWPVLLVGVPLILGTVLVLAFVRVSEGARRKLHEHRAQRARPVVAGGLMSGFFTPAPSGEDRARR
jgi:hypothetical protein